MITGEKQQAAQAKTASKPKDGYIRTFVKRNYRHFNAAVIQDAAEAWIDLVDRGDKMLVAVAGAMSTGELGISLAEMIREGKVHAISCTGANLEEDLFNLVAHDHYKRIPNYRDLSPDVTTGAMWALLRGGPGAPRPAPAGRPSETGSRSRRRDPQGRRTEREREACERFRPCGPRA